MLREEESFGIKKFKTYEVFGKKFIKLERMLEKNIKKLRKENDLLIGYGAPAKATTALNFFGISKEINFIVEDNMLKHKKFIPGVKIPIKINQTLKQRKIL